MVQVSPRPRPLDVGWSALKGEWEKPPEKPIILWKPYLLWKVVTVNWTASIWSHKNEYLVAKYLLNRNQMEAYIYISIYNNDLDDAHKNWNTIFKRKNIQDWYSKHKTGPTLNSCHNRFYCHSAIPAPLFHLCPCISTHPTAGSSQVPPIGTSGRWKLPFEYVVGMWHPAIHLGSELPGMGGIWSLIFMVPHVSKWVSSSSWKS